MENSDLLISEVITALDGKMSVEDIKKVRIELGKVVEKYNVEKMERLPATYNGFPEEVKQFLAVKKVEGSSDGTIENYSLILKKFFNLTKLTVQQTTSNNIRVYLYRYQEKYGTSNRTLEHMRTVITIFFSWCAAEGIIDRDPGRLVRPIKYEVKQREYLTDKELNQLRSSCTTINEKALLEFFYSIGCRVSELVNARLDKLNLDNNELEVLGKGNKWRTVYLNSKSKEFLSEYLNTRKDNEPYIFVTKKGQACNKSHKYNVSGIAATLRKLGIRAGVKKKIHPHLLRHTTATLGLQHGMQIEQIQKMLGHSQIGTTMVYTSVEKEAVKKAHQIYIV